MPHDTRHSFTVSCAGCGLTLLRTHPRSTRGPAWCSDQCRYQAQRQKKPVERTCQICGVQFLGRPNANLCSSKCRNRRSYLIGVATGSHPRNREAWRAKQRAEGNGHKLNVWTESKKAAYQRRRALKEGAAAERFPNSEIFERDGWRCQLCGRKVDPALRYPSPMSASIDHIVPLSVPGGPGHVRANVQLAHLGCNTKKSNGVAGSGEQLRLIG